MSHSILICNLPINYTKDNVKDLLFNQLFLDKPLSVEILEEGRSLVEGKRYKCANKDGFTTCTVILEYDELEKASNAID